jgi:hypothetical protein
LLGIYFHIIASLLFAHDFHVSKTVLNYISDQEAIQITIHVFLDDLELALKDLDDSKMNLFTSEESAKADSLISVYLNEHLKISLDGNIITPIYLGKEISDDLSASWCYLESVDVKKFADLDLSVSIFNKQFDDQRNIVDFKLDNRSISFDILDVENEKKHIRI